MGGGGWLFLCPGSWICSLLAGDTPQEDPSLTTVGSLVVWGDAPSCPLPLPDSLVDSHTEPVWLLPLAQTQMLCWEIHPQAKDDWQRLGLGVGSSHLLALLTPQPPQKPEVFSFW